MNSYAHRWRLAVALKQPYPSPSDTGAPSLYQDAKWEEQRRGAVIWGFGIGSALLLLSWFGAPSTAPEGTES